MEPYDHRLKAGNFHLLLPSGDAIRLVSLKRLSIQVCLLESRAIVLVRADNGAKDGAPPRQVLGYFTEKSCSGKLSESHTQHLIYDLKSQYRLDMAPAAAYIEETAGNDPSLPVSCQHGEPKKRISNSTDMSQGHSFGTLSRILTSNNRSGARAVIGLSPGRCGNPQKSAGTP